MVPAHLKTFTHCNSTQNIWPIHRKIFSCIKILRALWFKSPYAFLKHPLGRSGGILWNHDPWSAHINNHQYPKKVCSNHVILVPWYPGTHPTNHIGIKLKIQRNFTMLLFIAYLADHNEILHMTTVILSRHLQKFFVIGWAHSGTAYIDQISNLTEMPLVSIAPADSLCCWGFAKSYENIFGWILIAKSYENIFGWILIAHSVAREHHWLAKRPSKFPHNIPNVLDRWSWCCGCHARLWNLHDVANK